MKKRGRPFLKNIINHCYQRSADGGVIFYSKSDYLVWFTIVCTRARKHNVQILAMCPMPDHVHLSAVTAKREELSAFMGEYSHDFALAYNKNCHTSGPVFKHPFGSAPKNGSKAGKTNIIYIGNNPHERQLTQNAEDYRWTFIAYAVSDHPFSEKLVIRRSGKAMRRAIKEIVSCRKADKPLSYAQLYRLFKPLDQKESLQLIDYIIVQYNAIDYNAMLQFFGGSYESLLTAIHSTSGSEYDLNEAFIGKSDTCYNDFAKVLIREKGYKDIHEFLSLDNSKKYDLFLILRKYTQAMNVQICKYLHLEMDCK